MAIILFITILSYSVMQQTLKSLEAIIAVEEVKLYRYAEITELVVDARDYLYDYINRKEENMPSIIFALNEVGGRLEIINRLHPDLGETKILKEISSEVQHLKTILFSYDKEVKEGYQGGGSAHELGQIVLEANEDIIMLVRSAAQAVRQHIEANQNQILKVTRLSGKVLTLSLILGIVSTFFILLFMGYALSYPIHQLVIATEEIARGNLDYKLKLTSDHEFNQITTAFNQMATDLRRSQEEILRSKEMLTQDIIQRRDLEENLKANVLNLERSKAELQKKVEELEKFTKLAVDRELKMVELKQRIKELEGGGKSV